MAMIRKIHPLAKIINASIIDLPTPINISYMWNFGSLLGLCLMIQLLTGIFLSIHYTANIEMAFSSIAHICQDVNYGWIMRYAHMNGASIFFICIYIHTIRNIYFSSYSFTPTWSVGVIILFLLMLTAFTGYILPWGQMSFWGATVITNLLSAIPYLGEAAVNWLWGGFAVDNPTLTRFFSFHFLFPFMIMALVIIHILFLHQTGSNNPLGLNSNLMKIPFHPYFTSKDTMGFMIMSFLLIIISLLSPNIMSDPENFNPANPLITPVHIQPEWYFLFAYAILRSVPNKLGGVIALVMSISTLFFLPLMTTKTFHSANFYPLAQSLCWVLISTVALLTWIGARPVEIPYIFMGQILTFTYFLTFPSFFITSKFWDKILS